MLNANIRLWLDDQRDMPSNYNLHVKTARDAISALSVGNVVAASLDHDLGDEKINGNGYDIAKWIEKQAYFGNIDPIEINIHSDNGVGRQNMLAAIKNAYKYWQSKNSQP